MDVNEIIILSQKDKDIKVPTFADFIKICRVCLNDITEPDSCKNIYEEECKMRIKTLLEVYAYAKIPKTQDSLPQNICSECAAFLIEIHIFRSRCKVNENLLSKIQKKAKESVEAIQVRHSYANMDTSNSETGFNDVDNLSFRQEQIYAHINEERMGLFKCKDCHLVFSDKKELYAHRMEAKHSRRPGSPCPYCGRLFNSTTLIQHIRTHTKEKPYTCEFCNASFSNKSNMDRHARVHSVDGLQICEMCGKTFTQLGTLRQHQKQQHNDEGKKNDPKKTVGCALRGKVYHSDNLLKMHMRAHRKTSKMFMCAICEKVFSMKSVLKEHIRVHTGEKPFVCAVCKRCFAQLSTLRTHMTTHTGEKPHRCVHCDRRFAVRGNLIAHQRIHTGKSPHKCTICNQSFYHSSALKKHFRSHNTVELFQTQFVQVEEKEKHELDEEIAVREELQQATEMLKVDLGIEYVTEEGIVIENHEEEDDNVYYLEMEDDAPENT